MDLGGVLIAEAWPEARRKTGAGWMHTGYYFGIFLAAIANATIGAWLGWRAMFVLGGAPALLVGYIRSGVREPARWKGQARAASDAVSDAIRDTGASFGGPLRALFSPALRRRTLMNSIYLLISMTGLWAGSVYVPSSVTQIAARAGHNAVSAAHLASWATMLLSACTIVGCLIMPPLAERIGRRATLGLYFALMFVLHRLRIRLCILSAARRPGMVPAFAGVSGRRRSELRRLHAVAARAVPGLMPRQRICLCHIRRSLFCRRSHAAGRRGHRALQDPRHAGCLDFRSVPARLVVAIPFGEETRGKALPE
jgi:MFS family permease